MEILEENLMEYLKRERRNVSFFEIREAIGNEYENNDILTALVTLEKQGKIFKNKKNEFQLWHNGIGRIYGTITITSKGIGILKEESGKVTFIQKEYLNGALNGDKAIVKDLKMVRDRQEGRVEKIVDRIQTSILCEVTNKAGIKRLKPLIENDELKIKVNQEELKKYVEGDRLLVNIGLEKEEERFLGNIIKKVCHKDDPKSDIITIAAFYGFDFDFPDEVKEEVKNIPTNISNEDISERVDLRDKTIFTIDGEDTKDIDDAISLEVLPNGNYKLSVHIADVSYYVKPGTAIFREALKRGTSLYMLNSVIPMLPRELSNGICSLNPNEDRLAKSCEMEIDKNGNIINSKIFDSVICSNKKMSYTEVNKILEENSIPEGYEEYTEILKTMHSLSEKMNQKRKRRGSVEFDNPEIKIMTDSKGKLYDIKILRQRSGELLIENFMLSANEAVATNIKRRKLPFIYRVHDKPDELKLGKIIDIICENNSEIKKPSSSMIYSKTIQKFLDTINGLKEYPAYSNMILRGLAKAEYSADNIGHHGLALKYYTHFTSPIRRFPDLLVHHLLNFYDKKDISNVNLRELETQINEVAFIASERERAAQSAEYDANDMKTAEYMMNYIGEEFEGTITDINERGMNVVLDNLIEGYINIADIEPKSFFKYYKNRKMLMSEDEKYCLGDRVNLILKSANKKQRKISFTATGHTKEKRKQENKEKIKTKEFKYGQN